MSYSDRLLAVQPDHQLGYWAMGEASGAAAADLTGNGHDGTYHNVTLGEPGIGDGSTAVTFNGTTSVLDVWSASLAAAFTPGEFTISLWLKVPLAVWTDNDVSRLLTWQVNAQNRVLFQKQATTGFAVGYAAGGVAKSISKTDIVTNAEWVCAILTVSKTANAMKLYIDGLQQGTTQTGLGTWVGTLPYTHMVIGAQDITPVNVLIGSLAHVAVWNVALTAAEAAEVSSVFGAVTTPASRTYVVPREDRTYRIPKQDRVFVIRRTAGASRRKAFEPKDPEAKLDYIVDWGQVLIDDPIVASTWSVPAGMRRVASSIDATRTTVWLSGGTHAAEYRVTNHITTTAGRSDSCSLIVPVRQT